MHFRPAQAVLNDVYYGCPPPQNPAVHLQVALLAEKVSNSGRFIRLGETSGDEIVGWTTIDSIEVVEVLGELSEDGKTVIPLLEPQIMAIRSING